MPGPQETFREPAVPLARFARFRTHDLDEAREAVGRIFCPHQLNTIGKAPFQARHHHVPGERVSLNYIEYGAKTQIAPGCLDQFYLVQIPVSGSAAIVNGTDRYTSDAGRAAVLNPHRETTMIWEEGCKQLLLQISRRALTAHANANLGLTTDQPIAFEGALDLTSPAGTRLLRLVHLLVADAEQARDPALPPSAPFPAPSAVSENPSPLLTHYMENTVMTGLLEAHRHNYSGQLRRVTSSVIPGHVRRAQAYMLANLDRPLDIDEIAAYAGVSARNLQLGFKRFLSMAPMAYLRDIRLQRAHEDLLQGRREASVTEVAERWGMTHLGRFSQYYKTRYGCTPQETLKNARARDFLG
ncbi:MULTISPECIES: AraC family transcriptional regulator [Rhodobacterales]|uniref:AraC family transcriptional regulator n=1 Tax=Rhodobacterales TaxID=204455 RepID=UPI00237F9B5B|nr:AraC family transcriptional regulator [Phaeobacter gallaeciensis]MEE2635102.1 AraC family transcriptional regulator [Pseudomonadota bacterium]MDE4097021.1 AraC family transcriptional regulator [Phaeobacter gallaeciensis]MDE4105685.1 AraC family transcriptional regulator [Phaeobacter gallaeciensis]MDE4110288.1 AraC family transcriptional regulator [Phaeobacter gallaeciensis]MDE4114756.1 AraC family transcriptional regulator [Phaeobacter gallaeciensis]